VGLLGLVARFGSNWLEKVEPMIGGACGSDRGRGMDGWRQRRVILFVHAASFKSCPRNQQYDENRYLKPRNSSESRGFFAFCSLAHSVAMARHRQDNSGVCAFMGASQLLATFVNQRRSSPSPASVIE
jgi:hypothetical protein